MSRKIELERLGLYLKLALEILNENDGQMASRDVTREVETRLDLVFESVE